MANRADGIGLFWIDEPKVKAPPKEKVKRIPPKRTWELPSYLPGLEIARAYVPDLFNDMELWQAAKNKEHLLFDMEVYPNYVLLAFRSVESKKIIYFELSNIWSHTSELFLAKLLWVLQSFCIINFNGRRFDFVIAALAVAGKTTEAMWEATDMIISQGLQNQDVYKHFSIKGLKDIDQIDLIELTALGPGLKVCAGRLHAKKLQDLPFKPGTILSEDQAIIVRHYCFNDLDNTELLYHAVKKLINIRQDNSVKYGLDLRSHSDAQMSEAIINAEVKRVTGRKFIPKTKLPPGTVYQFKTPKFIKYNSALMQHVLGVIQAADFFIDPITGSVVMPPALAEMVVEINKSKYKIGIGGLHSQEKSIAHYTDDNYIIIDTDATSYYPKLILNSGLMPKNLGKDFLIIYNNLTTTRVKAKHQAEAIDKRMKTITDPELLASLKAQRDELDAVALCLKIVINGAFGKLGSVWSIMYAPDLMIQVTITGQLSILMLAEAFELAGIEVTSINTDGIVTKVHRSKEAEFNQIVKAWEKTTGFETEETRYKATFSRDINNYFAIYETPQKGKLYKGKGAYGPTEPKKNAVNEICVDAVSKLLLHGTPITTTILACKEIHKFTTMRAVTGGAVKVLEKDELDNATNVLYLGKIIRWYYSTDAQGDIIYAKTGNKVARSDGAKPLMDLPDSFPNDVNYEWYYQEAYKILEEIGHSKPQQIAA